MKTLEEIRRAVEADTEGRWTAMTVLEALGAATPPDVASLWAPAKQEEIKIGWTYDFNQIERITRAAEKDTGFEATMEIVQFVMREADRRASTALRLSAGGGWRSMDSAPRDGTEIIIWAACEDGRGYRVSDAFYARSDWQNREGWAVDGDGEYDWIEGGGMSAKLWAPYPTLPASPTVEAGHVE